MKIRMAGVVCATILGFLVTAPANALVKYKYLGNPFDPALSLDETPPPGSYDDTMFVNGVFAVAAPIVPLLPLTDISAAVLKYSFRDGRQTLTEANSDILSFLISTDSGGVPVSWSIFLFADFPTQSVGEEQRLISTNNLPDPNPFLAFVTDFGSIGTCNSVAFSICDPFTVTADIGANEFDPGTWAIPEPSSLALIAVGIIMLGGLTRRGFGVSDA